MDWLAAVALVEEERATLNAMALKRVGSNERGGETKWRTSSFSRVELQL
jgi:hypothetical protein